MELGLSLSEISKIAVYGANPEYSEAARSEFSMDSPLAVEKVADALIMPAQKTPFDHDFEFFAGAYTADQIFIPHSTLKRRKGHISGPYPAEVLRVVSPQFRSGEAVFCGLMNQHFGHFLVEATARLWWGIRNNFRGKYLFQIFDDVNYKPAAKEFFELLGIGDQIEFIRTPTVFETLYVPQAAIIFNHSYASEYLLPFERVRQALANQVSDNSPKKIFLSRAGMQNRSVIGQDMVESWFVGQGYVSISPENLPLSEQIKLVLGADEIAGINGSAFHLLLFTRGKKTKTVMRDGPFNATYMMIDKATNTFAEYFFAYKKMQRASFGLLTPTLLDLERLAALLQRSGFALPAKMELPAKNRMMQQYLARWHAAFAQKISNTAPSDETLLPALLSHILDNDGPVDHSRLSRILAEAGYEQEAASLRPDQQE